METDYKKAWEAFQKTNDYANLMKMMRATDVRTATLYLENRIRIAFDAGWNAHCKVIQDVIAEGGK